MRLHLRSVHLRLFMSVYPFETHELKNAHERRSMLAGRESAELCSAMTAQEPEGRRSVEENVPDPRC